MHQLKIFKNYHSNNNKKTPEAWGWWWWGAEKSLTHVFEGIKELQGILSLEAMILEGRKTH